MRQEHCDDHADRRFFLFDTGQDFLTVFSVVIAFYFGTQSQRLNDLVDKGQEQPKA